MNENKELEKIIGYNFINSNLLKLALTHSSYANEKGMSKTSYNERIEFLGDAVLELVTSDFLYRKYPLMQEGELTKLRARLVCEDSLTIAARDINLGKFLYLGKGEDQTKGRERKSILSDAFEALIGAIHLDGGYLNASNFINQFVLVDIENRSRFIDSKTTLQELVQANYGIPVTYRVLEESGPEHDKHFVMAAFLKDEQLESGEGPSKKSATQDAAYHTILMLDKKGIRRK